MLFILFFCTPVLKIISEATSSISFSIRLTLFPPVALLRLVACFVCERVGGAYFHHEKKRKEENNEEIKTQNYETLTGNNQAAAFQ